MAVTFSLLLVAAMVRQTVAVELYYDAAWHNIVPSGDVLADTPITITRGQGDQGQAPRPAAVSMRLANDDDTYRTSNPVSPLYGKAGRNTPTRVTVGSTVRGVVEASSWQAGQSSDFRRAPSRGVSWVDLDGAGIMQRVNEWSQPLRSALYRYVALSGVTPAEWWPMEDVSGSSVAVSAIGGQAMEPVTTVRYTDPGGSVVPPGGAPRFADGDKITGSAALPSFQGGGTLSAPVRSTTWDGYAIDWVMQFQAGTDEGGTTSADVLSWRESGTYVHFTVNVTKGFVTVFHANAADDATLASTGSATAALDVYDGAPHHFRYQVRQSGGNYLAELRIDSGLYATADNFVPGMTGTVGYPTSIEWNPGEDRGDYLPIAAGHLIIWASGQGGGQPAVFYALNGYPGELAALRFSRLLTEEGIPYFVSPAYASSMPMGPQRPDTLQNLIREAARTDDALLYDYISAARIYFLCRTDRYNQTPAIQFTLADFPAPPTEYTDSTDVYNVMTASQRDGGDSTAQDDTGPLGTAAPPTGVGEKRGTVDVNVSSESLLANVANWWLRLGTVDRPRYPRVVVNLTALDAGRIALIESINVGSVITIDGYREDLIRLHVLGYTETIGPVERTITFTCAPDQQYDVAVYTAAGAPLASTQKRYESRTSTTNATSTTTATTIVVTFTDLRDAWSTTSVPYDWAIAGERITVTAMGAVTGAGPYTQSATVTRSVNGVVKTHVAGETIHMHPDQQARYAL